MSEEGEAPLPRYLGTVRDVEDVDQLLAKGFRPVVEGGKVLLVRGTGDGTVEYYVVDRGSEAFRRLAQVSQVDVVEDTAFAVGYSDVSRFVETGIVYGAFAALHSAIDELRFLLLDAMDPYDKQRFAYRSRTAAIYLESRRRGVFTRYALSPGAGEAARKVLTTIISLVSSQPTPSAIQAAITAKLLLHMLRYDVVYTGYEYEGCVKSAVARGASRDEAEERCSDLLHLPGRWYVESLSGRPADEEVMSLLNELEASVAMAFGESSWGEDVLRYNQVILWLYKDNCPNCAMIMRTRNFREFVEAMMRFRDIPVFPVNADFGVSKSVVYQYLTIKTLLMDRGLTTPILVFYDVPERRIVIWSSSQRDHDLLPIPEHVSDPPLPCVFLRCEKRCDESGCWLEPTEKERDDCLEVISRVLFEQQLVVKEGRTRAEVISRILINILREAGGVMPRRELVRIVARRARTAPQYVGKIIGQLAARGRIIIDDKNNVHLQ